MWLGLWRVPVQPESGGDSVTGTVIVLPHREAFSVDRPGAIALTLATQLEHESIYSPLWGDPLRAAPLVPAVPYVELATPKWWPARQTVRYRWAIARAIKQHAPRRLEIQNRAHLFHEFSHLKLGLSLYIHNDPQSIRGLKTPKDRQRMLMRADYVVAVSEFIRQHLCEGVPASLCERVVVVPNTLDLTRFAPETEKQKEILFVGRLIPEKGALPLLQALQTVLPRFPEWRARFIGAWHFGQTAAQYPHERELLAMLRPEMRDRILFDWYQPYEVVTAAFNRAAVAVVPSLWMEPFGRTALEGMAAGCAVIASNRGGLPEVVGEAGLLVDPTAENLTDALATLLSDDDYRQAMGVLGAARARTVFEPSSIHEKINLLRRS